MMRPTAVDPVKFTRRTAGWAMIASTTRSESSGVLVRKFSTPAGSPASCMTSATIAWVFGLSSDARKTTVLPQTMG